MRVMAPLVLSLSLEAACLMPQPMHTRTPATAAWQLDSAVAVPRHARWQLLGRISSLWRQEQALGERAWKRSCLDELIEEQRERLAACEREAQYAIEEAEQMKQQLNAFISKRTGTEQYKRRMGLRTVQSGLRAIMRRRRYLIELAAMRNVQARAHKAMLLTLEEQMADSRRAQLRVKHSSTAYL